MELIDEKTEYLQIVPKEHLKPYIRCFGILRNNGNSSYQTFKILADGCPGLIFQGKEGSFLDAENKPLPHLYIHGLTTKHSQNFACGNFNNIIVHFKPTALKSIFGMDADELTNKCIPLSDYVKNNITENLLETKSISDKIDLLSDFLTALILKNKQNIYTEKVDFAIRKMDEGYKNSFLKNILFDLNTSERSLERLFKSHIGISPKLFFRIVRFQSALQLLRHHHSEALTKIAYGFNYADQSHYNREFKEFAGASPKEFIKKAHGLAANFPNWKA